MSKYFWRKLAFWFGILLVMAGVFYYLLIEANHSNSNKLKIISVGIAGEVKQPGIYRLAQHSDLAKLIDLAGGLNPQADFLTIDLYQTVENDSVYSIPSKSMDSKEYIEIKQAYADFYKKDSLQISKIPNNKLEQINFLYHCFPSVFILITFYPSEKIINLTYLPQSTVFLDEKYKLIELYFQLGINPLIYTLEKSLNIQIQYFLIQDKNSFVNFVDLMDGIEVNIDQSFANYTNIKPGINQLDGSYAWQYIWFNDAKIKAKQSQEKNSPSKAVYSNSNLMQLNTVRDARFRNVFYALRTRFKNENTTNQLRYLQQLYASIETNIDKDLLISLYSAMLSTSKFSFGNLPGSYAEISGQMLYFPSKNGMNDLHAVESRKTLNPK